MVNIPFLCIRKPNYMLKRVLFFIAMTLTVSTFVTAQITTSTLSGSVKSKTDEALVGATIVATHLPTGTKYTTISRSGGVIRIDNMRSGGPYTVEVSYVGYDKETFTDVFLQLAESFILNVSLKKSETTLETVVLTTSGRSLILNKNRTGAVTNIGLRQITNLPTITRSLNDLTRATPQSNGASIGGGNYRQNNFTIDGADFNNSFGIGGNLPANGAPISLDAVGEISVNLTPFDIRQSGFIGSAINAVTRSGTNQFAGSVYKYFRNEKYRGDQVEKEKFIRPVEDFKQWGFRIGGPIIKNKLFFFLNYESEVQPKAIQTNFAATASAPYGSSPNVARPTADSLNYISNYLLTNYGYITGPYDNYTPNIERKKYMARLDWNINNNHNLVLRYSQVEGGEPNPLSSSTGGSGTPGWPERAVATRARALSYRSRPASSTPRSGPEASPPSSCSSACRGGPSRASTARASRCRAPAGSTTGSSSGPARRWSNCRPRRPASCPTRRNSTGCSRAAASRR